MFMRRLEAMHAKYVADRDQLFKELANGVPGLQVRLPLLFSEGVGKGRLTLNQFVALTATNHARMYGLHPRKGTGAQKGQKLLSFSASSTCVAKPGTDASP